MSKAQGQFTIIDYNDALTLTGYIGSNLAKTQMYNPDNGWMYCGVYSDEAVTGTKRERAGFQHMIEECRQGNIDLVITKSISRFARNTVTLLQTVRELKSLGIDVFFEEQHIHTMSADGELMMTILASYAHGRFPHKKEEGQ